MDLIHWGLNKYNKLVDWLNEPTNSEDLIPHKVLFSLILILVFLAWFYLSYLNYNYELYYASLNSFNNSFNLSNF
jgi:hypothetical protein